MRLNRIAYSGLTCAAVVLTLAGCSASAAQQALLPNTALSDILPTGLEYTAYNGGVSWGATTTEIPLSSLGPTDGATGSATGGATAIQVGADCATLSNSPPPDFSPLRGAAQQEVQYGGGDEFVVLYRTKSAGAAKSILDWELKTQTACDKNEGQMVFTNVDIGVSGAVGGTSQLHIGSDSYFTGYGQRGDLIVMVSNNNSDGAAVGAQTLKYVLNHIDDLAAGRK